MTLIYINKIQPKWHVAIMETTEYRTHLWVRFSHARTPEILGDTA